MYLGITSWTLEKAFKDCGEIESIRYRCVPVNDPSVPKKVIAIKKDFHPERHNCVGFICFKTNEAAEKALELNGHELKGLHIRVDWASKDKEKDVKKSVFVGNLPFDVEEEAVRNHFEDCGKITNVRLIRDKKTCIGKGFGYVTFEDKDGVGFAMKLSGQKLKGRELRVMACSSSAGHEKKHKQVKISFCFSKLYVFWYENVSQSPGLKEKKQKTKQQLPSNPSKTAFKGEESKKEKTKKKDKKSYSKKIKVPFKTITKDDGLKADIQALIDSETKKGGESTKEPKVDKIDKTMKIKEKKIKTVDTGEKNKVENGKKAFTKAQSSSNGKADLEKFGKKVNAIKPGTSDGKADKFEKKQTFDKKGFGKQENRKFGNKMNKSFGGFDKRGGKPFENKGSKPPFESRGGKPFENKGSKPPFESRGGKPFENKGSKPPFESRGGKPFENKGSKPPFESRGGKPFENRSGKQFPNREQKSFDRPGNSSFSRSGNKSFDSNPGRKPFNSTPRPGFSSKPLSGLVQGSGKHIKFD
ncbi:RNA-binding motif protein, X-linked 2-like [Mya arenaria]|uniref:RNA-binding motif protein, X-linked 2-like n=1 Tax=Mya arenaria TaxID=6604 RepID=UPI0022E90931|nr:RNA-binding motif protein, X-linked 2-like [Mya arenaria]